MCMVNLESDWKERFVIPDSFGTEEFTQFYQGLSIDVKCKVVEESLLIASDKLLSVLSDSTKSMEDKEQCRREHAVAEFKFLDMVFNDPSLPDLE